MKKSLLFILVLPLMALQCEKNPKRSSEPEKKVLPPITTEGKGTFGCLINGEVFLPKTPNSIFGPKLPELWSTYTRHSDNYYLEGVYKDDSLQQHVGLQLDSLLYSSEKLKLFSGDSMQFGFFGYYDKTKQKMYWGYTTSTLKGELNILRLDTISRIIAGTFFFTVVTDNNDTIRITEGRFDVPYSVQN